MTEQREISSCQCFVRCPVQLWDYLSDMLASLPRAYTIGRGLEIAKDSDGPATHLGKPFKLKPSQVVFVRALLSGEFTPEFGDHTEEEIRGMLAHVVFDCDIRHPDKTDDRGEIIPGPLMNAKEVLAHTLQRDGLTLVIKEEDLV
jgi:hypothetical protein